MEAMAADVDFARWIREIGRGPHAARALDSGAARALGTAWLEGPLRPRQLGAILLGNR
jgi:anthranilate phosphoribosyltransferase